MRVIGLMSGTSIDGIDAALVTIQGKNLDLSVHLHGSSTYSYQRQLRQQLLEVCAGAPLSMAAFAQLDDAIAHAFAEAARQLQADYGPADLIGSHGQTVFHRPPCGNHLGYSLQLGRGDLIAHLSQLPTVSNFRVHDIAQGGQGAPLVSRVDLSLLGHPEKSRCIQNIGGIGNVTFVPPLRQVDDHGSGVVGWDTGPGNVLLDLAVHHFSQGEKTYDRDGEWAATGNICQPLVDQWLNHPFFQEPPPKSTGRELFSPEFLQACLRDAQPYDLRAADCLATLTELTAAAIALNYRQFLVSPPEQVLLCGGGAHNTYLRQRIAHHLAPIPVLTTTEMGIPVDAKEAIAFAVLAYWHHHHDPGNLPSVTGAKAAIPLGQAWG